MTRRHSEQVTCTRAHVEFYVHGPSCPRVRGPEQPSFQERTTFQKAFLGRAQNKKHHRVHLWVV